MEPSTLASDARAALDQFPREALRLAQEAYALACARRDARARAECALTLAHALNTFGEFQNALPLCNLAATEFSQWNENVQVARALCEAAWAYSFLGKLRDAAETIARIRASLDASDIVQAYCDWIEARGLRDQGHSSEAEALLQKACATFKSVPLPLDAARCECEWARTLLLSDRDATMILDRARETFAAARCPLDIAQCEYLRALSLQRRNRYAEAIQVFLAARQQFNGLGAHFFAAWCDLELGICYRLLNRFDESLHASQNARAYFLARKIHSEAFACTINLANTYYSLNRYDEALSLYQQALQASLAEGRRLRTSIVHENIALVYAKQGLFSRALDLHQRALQMFTEEKRTVLAATCQVNLAITCRQLGQFKEARQHLHQARILFTQQQQLIYLAECDLELAQVHLALGEPAQAVACLSQARDLCVMNGLEAWVARCDHLLAQIASQEGEREHALALVAHSRSTFLKHTQVVDAALCDLTEGGLHLQWGQITTAQECFQRAHAVLFPGFPDQAWRADYGIGQCAARLGDLPRALDHHLRAVNTIACSRAMLVTEQLSNEFFMHHQSVYADALALALSQNAVESALAVIEVSKARTFLALLQNRGWKLRHYAGDPYVASLVARERDLRYQLNALRQRMAVQTEKDSGEALRSAQDLAPSGDALQELNALSHTYESVVSQLRLATTGLAGVSAPPPFALDQFRHAANAAFDSNWVALDYYFADDTLVTVIVRPHRLDVESRKLSPYDRAIIGKCASTEPDLRELVYRGTLHGVPVPSSGMSDLRHLYRLLIPQRLDAQTLIIAPHGLLHALPFHALITPHNDTHLIEQHTVVYTPSLQVLCLLLADSLDAPITYPLVLGLSQFEEPLHPLSAAKVEMDAIRQAFAGRGEFLWGVQASRQKIFDLDASGKLQQFDLVHFATHAILDHSAPHQSRVVLSDGALMTTDILDLSFNARLVTLSACQTALGKGGRGDEWVGLARAFFYAGARALVASLWHVEDRSAMELIGPFYHRVAKGESAAASLRSAQIEMIRAGHPPYRWSPFIFIGRP